MHANYVLIVKKCSLFLTWRGKQNEKVLNFDRFLKNCNTFHKILENSNFEPYGPYWQPLFIPVYWRLSNSEHDKGIITGIILAYVYVIEFSKLEKSTSLEVLFVGMPIFCQKCVLVFIGLICGRKLRKLCSTIKIRLQFGN